MRADRRLYIDRRGKLVAESDPEAAVMLCAKGRDIEPGDVKALGLWLDDDGKVQQGEKAAPVAMPEPEPVTEPAPKRVWPSQSRRSGKKL